MKKKILNQTLNFTSFLNYFINYIQCFLPVCQSGLFIQKKNMVGEWNIERAEPFSNLIMALSTICKQLNPHLSGLNKQRPWALKCILFCNCATSPFQCQIMHFCREDKRVMKNFSESNCLFVTLKVQILFLENEKRQIIAC